jgi:putative ABC transport system ATP-binding protein
LMGSPLTAPEPVAPGPLVELSGVGKTYGDGESRVHALVDADLRVYPGEVLLILGPSGSGKTTLLSILGLLLRPTTGDITVDGRCVTGLGEKHLPAIRASTFGFIFQGFNLFEALTALENVALATKLKTSRVPDPFGEARRLLVQVGLGDRLHHTPAALSGGQKQRVAIARALGGSPRVILGDEPTAALDSKTGLAVMELLRSLAKDENRGVVVVTHDQRLERFADRIVRVEDGRVLPEGRPPAESEDRQAGAPKPSLVLR